MTEGRVCDEVMEVLLIERDIAVCERRATRLEVEAVSCEHDARLYRLEAAKFREELREFLEKRKVCIE